ncbi:MAG: hypothetical protein WC998_00760 [Candidatus Paceibacterota bacterium]|jgi:hypothetical protein
MESLGENKLWHLLRTTKSVKMVEEALKHKEENIRLTALTAAQRLQLWDLVKPLVNDSKKEVMWWAADILQRNGIAT